MSTHILACISSHGFGHFAMTAPILNELNKFDSIKLTVRCALPENLIRSRITGDFGIIAESSDFGMIMNGSLDVELEESASSYLELHENFENAVEAEKRKLADINADLVFVNIPYLSIVAAAKLDLPVIAYCSLNWAEIFNSYYKDKLPQANEIYQVIINAYNQADAFICPAPSMAMPGLNNIINVGPVARIAINHREQIDQQFPRVKGNKLVLITPGGVVTPVPVNSWPLIPGIIWITAWPYQSERLDVLSIDQLGISFNELVVSCDALVTKPGYGTVTEAVCNAIPALYVLRGDWAEESFLVDWWCKNGTVLEISRQDFMSGNIHNKLTKLWQLPASQSLPATGIEQVIRIVNQYVTS